MMFAELRILGWRRLTIAIALGIVTSVAVAIPLGLPEPKDARYHVSHDNVLLNRISAPQATMYQCWIIGDDALPVVPADAWNMQDIARTQRYGDPMSREIHGNPNWILFWNSEEWGWPVRCLWCWYARPFQGSVIDHGLGIRLADRAEVMPGNPRFVPLMPIWSGLAINMLVFAAPWWIVLLAASYARLTLRARRGRCVRCGYDLRGSTTNTCPECGATTTTA